MKPVPEMTEAELLAQYEAYSREREQQERDRRKAFRMEAERVVAPIGNATIATEIERVEEHVAALASLNEEIASEVTRQLRYLRSLRAGTARLGDMEHSRDTAACFFRVLTDASVDTPMRRALARLAADQAADRSGS